MLKQNLQDLTPRSVTKTVQVVNHINSQPQDFIFVFRPYVAADDIWLKQNFKDKEVTDAFNNMDMTVLGKIMFHQFDLETQQRIMKVKFMSLNEESGETEEKYKTGGEKVSAIVGGPVIISEMIAGLLECKGFGMPLIEKLAEEEIKKNKKMASGLK